MHALYVDALFAALLFIVATASDGLPVIDLESLLYVEDAFAFASDPCIQAIHDAIKTHGFFYIKNHGVPPFLFKRIYSQSYEFFQYPEIEKRRISMEKGGSAWRGYFSVGEELTSNRPDMKEGIYFGTEMTDTGLPLQGKNLWPRKVNATSSTGNGGVLLKEDVLLYMQHMSRVGTLLMKAICAGILKNLSHPKEVQIDAINQLIESFETNPTELFRIFGYPNGEGNVKTVELKSDEHVHTTNSTSSYFGVGKHTDYGFLTLLYQDASGGLQVQSLENANKWIAADPIQDTLVINIGDALEYYISQATGVPGYFRATPHRVLFNREGDKDKRSMRISFPYFFDPKMDALMTPRSSISANKDNNDLDSGTRWDNENLHQYSGTYGDYLMKKISKVFPKLFSSTVENGKDNETCFFEPSANHIYDYLVIGAGPAGLQAAYYLDKYGQDYAVLERNTEGIVGSFFQQYPIHRKLISINKVNTGTSHRDFNLRHDWNSLLTEDDEDPILMTSYSSEYFPKADTLVDMLNDYQARYKLRISFGQQVMHIRRMEREASDDTLYFEVSTQKGTYMCKKLIVATGLFTPHRIKNVPRHYTTPYTDLSRHDLVKYTNKTILIIGQGNSAFETADHLLDTAAVIHVAGRGPLKFAWQTHYVGDLRARNNEFLDTYLLKSQNGLIEYNDELDKLTKIEGSEKYAFDPDTANEGDGPPDGYDYVLDCTGFVFDKSIFDETTMPILMNANKRIPAIRADFMSPHVDNLYFAGVVAQDLSFKKSSGAFIHGFRYLIRTMIKMQTFNVDTSLFSYETSYMGTQDSLFSKIVDRINTASGIYQMFNTLGDIVLYLNDNKTILYLEDIPVKLLSEDGGRAFLDLVQQLKVKRRASSDDNSGFGSSSEFEEYAHRYVQQHNVREHISKILVVTLDYGNFGGVIEHSRTLGNASYVFGVDRAEGASLETAHLSNFLHPIFRVYKDIYETEEILANKVTDYHLAENIMTEFKSYETHLQPLRKFLKHISNVS